MPAKDRYHDTVKRALIKDGWNIVHEQYFIKYDARHLWIDIQAEQATDQQIVLIEIKGFEDVASPIQYLEATLGQYLLYQAVIEALEISIPIFLAVPINAYNGFLSQAISQVGLRKAEVKLLVFDPVEEEIVQWIP